MTLIRPFAAHLPVPAYAADVVSPPLGRLTTREWLELSEENPHSFLHVIRTEIDTEEGGSDPYLHRTTGRVRLRQMIDTGVLRSTNRPAYYVYRICEGETAAVGLVAEVAVAGYGDGRILRHENTREATEELLLSHLRRLGAHSDPVALTHRSDADLAGLVARIRMRPADLEFRSSDGALQEVWVVDAPALVELVEERLAEIGPLYVTDGHHRCAAAVRYAEERRRANPTHRGDEDYNYVLAALFPESELTLREFNRCVRSAEHTPDAILAALGEVAALEAVAGPDDARPRRPGEVGVITGGRAYRFALPPPPAAAGPAAALDVSRLQHAVLGPLFAITDPRTDHRLHYVAGGQSVDPAHHHCVACFLLHPASVAEVMSVADAGMVMPPKSTWFEPKVRGGLFVTLLDA